MGFCDSVNDQVPCGANPKLPFTGHDQWNFPFPGGLTPESANTSNGLAGSGLPEDWVINGQTPSTSGIPDTGMPTDIEVEPITPGS
jgi:hypothetical protein